MSPCTYSSTDAHPATHSAVYVSNELHSALSILSHVLGLPGASYTVAIQRISSSSESVCVTVNVTVVPSVFSTTIGSKINSSFPAIGVM